MRRGILSNMGITKAAITLASSLFLGIACVMGCSEPVMAATITVDGNPSEWENVIVHESTDSNVSKWAVAKDEDNLYLYVQQNGGNAWGMPITSTYIELEYASGLRNEKSQIRFALDGNMQVIFKNAWYGDIAGGSSAYARSQESNKYEIECVIPLDYFAEDDFTFHYCGDSIDSSNIVDISTVDAPQESEAVYEGITVDGSFSDWNAVEKTPVGENSMVSTAMVFDGDWIYIYMEEEAEGSLTWSGESANGKFTIYTDTGRNTTFKLNMDSIEGVEGAKVAHSNCQYEIALPASVARPYKDTISYGFYMGKEMLISDVANLQEDTQPEDKEFTGIVCDGFYSDWNYYPHQLVQYSTSGGVGGDAEAALYMNDGMLYGHVLSYLHMNEKEFQPFYIRINDERKLSMQIQLIAADENGNVIKDAPLDNLDEGTYTFYLKDSSVGAPVMNVFDEDAPVYGKMYLTVRKSGTGKSISDEMEYEMDLTKLAEHFGLDETDIKMVQAQYVNIGGEWVSVGGTSTGAVMGISICGLVVAGVLMYRKRKCKVS